MRPLRAYLLRLGGDLALADDVLQDTYIRYLGMKPAHREQFPERPLLFRIATNLMYDHFRRRRREARATRGLWPFFFERPRALEGDDVARAFGALGERERALLWLAYVEEWPHAEMASSLGVRPGSIRVMLFRAKGALARLLRKRGLGPKESS
ncbi:MAG TPA: RNA polymerase sigma factor [Vicinamibacteria bacterium]|nr:RNA polymerase sigma factor [Vicinamibacteria bacterium]